MGTDGIFFAGWRGHDDLATALRCADIFVAPSFDEPFGQVYLEAMAAGLPVIGTNSGGPPSFINTDPSRLNGWLVTPDRSDELAHAIGIAVNDRALRQQRGRYGRQIIERGYDWRRIVFEYEAVYTQAVSGSFRRGEMPSRGVQAENIQATPDDRTGEVHIPSGRGVAARTKVAVARVVRRVVQECSTAAGATLWNVSLIQSACVFIASACPRTD